jgi:hypothetical protein
LIGTLQFLFKKTAICCAVLPVASVIEGSAPWFMRNSIDA